MSQARAGLSVGWQGPRAAGDQFRHVNRKMRRFVQSNRTVMYFSILPTSLYLNPVTKCFEIAVGIQTICTE